MKAIFPNSKSLQPMPAPNVHPNVSGNTNSTTNIVPNNSPTQIILNTQNNIPAQVETKNVKNNFLIFYILGLIIIIIVIIIIYKKFRENS